MLNPIVPFRSGGTEKKRDSWDIENLFDSYFKDSVFPSFFSNSGQMKVDIKENEKDYVVEAEIPGAKREEITLEIDDQRLTISSERKEETKANRENFIRRERRTSSMARSFALENVDAQKATAKFENGVLTVTLPKKEIVEVKKNKIEIE